MAELAVTDGMPPPDGLPRGEFTCTRLDDGTIRVDQADPRILISAELLHAIALDSIIADGTEAFALNARLDTAGCVPPQQRGWLGPYAGAVLHVHGVNRTVIYRITGYLPRIRAYIAEWPD
jgi:hypothetical protein